MAADILCLSYLLNRDTPAYGGEKELVDIKQIRSIVNGDTSNNTAFTFPAHIGTHIDFPRHFSTEGKTSSDYPASFWVFQKVGFLQCGIDEVENQIQNLDSDIELLILKTGFGEKRIFREYWAEQPVIPARFAGLLRAKFAALRVFGFDMISMTSKLDRPEGKKAHISFLLDHHILVLEDMKLNELRKAPKQVIIAPLLMDGVDGVPCNIFAFV